MTSLSHYFEPLAISHQYALTNPGAETGDMTGWTANAGTGMESTTTGLTSHSGSRHFGGASQLQAGSYQDVTAIAGGITEELIDSGRVALRLVYWGGSFTRQDSVVMYLRFFDGAPGSQITDTINFEPEVVAQGYASWIPNSLFWLALPGTRTIRVQMYAYRFSGTYNNGHADDIELHAYVLA